MKDFTTDMINNLYNNFDIIFKDYLHLDAIKYTLHTTTEDAFGEMHYNGRVGFIITKDYKAKLDHVTEKLIELSTCSIKYPTNKYIDYISFFKLDNRLTGIFDNNIRRVVLTEKNLNKNTVYYVRKEGFILGADIDLTKYVDKEIFSITGFITPPNEIRSGIYEAFKELVPEFMSGSMPIDYYLTKMLVLTDFNYSKIESKLQALKKKTNISLDNRAVIEMDKAIITLNIYDADTKNNPMFKLFISDLNWLAGMNDGFKEFNCKLEELLFNVDNYFGSDKVLLLSEDDNEVNIYIVRRLFIKTKELPLVQVHDNVFKSNTKWIMSEDYRPDVEIKITKK